MKIQADRLEYIIQTVTTDADLITYNQLGHFPSNCPRTSAHR